MGFNNIATQIKKIKHSKKIKKGKNINLVFNMNLFQIHQNFVWQKNLNVIE